MACLEGNVPGARYLLSLDADPNRAHTAGGMNTPLHEAVAGGNLAATRLLLKSSANVLAANAHGDLPLHVACRTDRLDIARRLLAHDADWNTVAALNHAGKRPCDVVRRSTALMALLKVVERKAAAAMGNRVSSSSKLSGARRSGNEISRVGRWTGGDYTSQLGKMSSTVGRIRSKSPKITSRNNPVLRARIAAAWGSLNTGKPLPRWARLPRPLRDEGEGEEEDEGAVPLGSASFAGSGTSYAASLTESDFDIPAPVTPVVKGRQKTPK